MMLGKQGDLCFGRCKVSVFFFFASLLAPRRDAPLLSLVFLVFPLVSFRFRTFPNLSSRWCLPAFLVIASKAKPIPWGNPDNAATRPWSETPYSKYPLFLRCFEKTWVSMVNTFFFRRGSTSYPKKGIWGRGRSFSRFFLSVFLDLRFCISQVWSVARWWGTAGSCAGQRAPGVEPPQWGGVLK